MILQMVLINNMGTSRAVGSRRPTLSSLSGSNNTSIPGAVSYTIHIHFSDTQRFEIPFYHEFLMPCRTSGIARYFLNQWNDWVVCAFRFLLLIRRLFAANKSKRASLPILIWCSSINGSSSSYSFLPPIRRWMYLILSTSFNTNSCSKPKASCCQKCW